jgi:glycerophosphoryl diester phosphodiesterase
MRNILYKTKKVFSLQIALCALCTLLMVFFVVQKQAHVRTNQNAIPIEVTPEMQIQKEDLSLIAHRGYTKDAPENTLASIKAAGEAGFWGCEFDIRRTADGMWVLMHDETLLRTLESDIAIREVSYADLQAYSYGRDEDDAHIRIPTLEEALLLCKSYNMMAYVEVKSAEMPTVYAEEIYEILKDCDMEGGSTVISFNESFAACMKAIAPHIFTALLTKSLSEDTIRFAEAN